MILYALCDISAVSALITVLNAENAELGKKGMKENNEQTIADETPNRKPLYIALVVIGVLVIATLGVWLLRGRETGQVVQPPRTVSFGDNTGGQTIETAGEQSVT